jgi:hypothetical protein
MSTGNFESWDGNILDLGPLYPFVGSEGLMVVILVALWIGWHIAQVVGESRDLTERIRRLNQQNGLQKALDAEHTIERM